MCCAFAFITTTCMDYYSLTLTNSQIRYKYMDCAEDAVMFTYEGFNMAILLFISHMNQYSGIQEAKNLLRKTKMI